MGNNTLYIRADGNAEIGTGHIMRCLAIARATKNLGKDCAFVVADGNMRPLLDEQGFRCICLNSVWSDLDRETAQMEGLIRRENIQSLLVDSYFVTPNYLSRLHRLTHVAYMDDLNTFVYPCSTLINYNLYAEGWNYPSRYPGVQLLLGPRYTPLREEFQNLTPRSVRQKVQDVLVTTGGSDPLNAAGQLVRRAKQTPEVADLTYHIVAGRFNPHLPKLERLAQTYPGIMLHCNVRHMSKLMLACDIAVSAGGSTLYELCACGTPTICFALADNQLGGVAAFRKRGMSSVGDIRINQEVKIVQIIDFIAVLQRNTEARRKQAAYLQTVVDGQGASHIVDSVTRCSSSHPAT